MSADQFRSSQNPVRYNTEHSIHKSLTESQQARHSIVTSSVQTMTQKTASNASESIGLILREALAEYLGTIILMVFGLGSVAQFVLSEGKTGSTDQVRWSWGFGVAFGVYVSGGVSGGHLNPAVTLTLCLFQRHPWKKLIPYWLGQYLGSFTASCIVFGVYYDALSTYKNGSRTLETAGIFATYPQPYLSMANGLGDQIFGTAVLMLVIIALNDPDNMGPSKGYLPLVVGLVVVAIGMTFSHNCGYPLNPARDLAPRLFTCIAGWGKEVFSHRDYHYFWVPIIGPHIGALLGGLIYEVCIYTALPCTCVPVSLKRPENQNIQTTEPPEQVVEDGEHAEPRPSFSFSVE